MTFASNPDADPDPTTQMTWPSSRRNASGPSILKSPHGGAGVESPQTERGPLRLDLSTANFKTIVNPPTKRRLTTKDLIFLSISMAGAQIAWTVELGYVFMGVEFRSLCGLWLLGHRATAGCLRTLDRYGTPFLLSLGLSEQLTSLVWLAGPISGLIAQPLIGTFITHNASLPLSLQSPLRSWSTSKTSSSVP